MIRVKQKPPYLRQQVKRQWRREYICVTKVPAPIIAQNEAVDQSFFLGRR